MITVQCKGSILIEVIYFSFALRTLTRTLKLSLVNYASLYKGVWGVVVWLHDFLKLCSKSNYWFVSSIGRFAPGESVPGTHVMGGLVGPRAGLAYV